MLKPAGGRRLSDSTLSVKAQAMQIHEFPASNTCPNLDNDLPKMLLAQDAAGSVTYASNPSMSTTAPTLSLASVNTDWSTNEIHSFPTPFHGGLCLHRTHRDIERGSSAPPSLNAPRKFPEKLAE